MLIKDWDILCIFYILMKNEQIFIVSVQILNIPEIRFNINKITINKIKILYSFLFPSPIHLPSHFFNKKEKQITIKLLFNYKRMMIKFMNTNITKNTVLSIL